MEPIHRSPRRALVPARRAALRTWPAALLLGGFTFVFMLGCLGPPTPSARIAAAHALAESAGLAPIAFDAKAALPIVAWHRSGDPALPVRVYIEGDGFAFERRGRRSDDPTPIRPVALELASRDAYPGDLVVLARPCQYEARGAVACDPTLWTAGRYGERVIAATSARLDALVRDRPSIDLAGFSGGGVVATLVAARRADVGFLTTFAAPLDVADWTRRLALPTLVLSLSPMDHVAALRTLPQQHFASEADRVVPPAVIQRYVDALGPSAPASLVVVPETAHADWARFDLDRVWADR